MTSLFKFRKKLLVNIYLIQFKDQENEKQYRNLCDIRNEMEIS